MYKEGREATLMLLTSKIFIVCDRFELILNKCVYYIYGSHSRLFCNVCYKLNFTHVPYRFLWASGIRANWGAEFVVPFSSRSQVVMKKSSNDTFFVQKESLCENFILWVKYGAVFTQIMMLSYKKVDNLRAREQEREEKGTTNSRP